MEYNYYDRLKESLEQVIAFENGDESKVHISVRTTNIPEYRAEDIARIRCLLNLSQRGLALALGVSARTVEAWEAGRNMPNGSARHLLYLFENENTLIERFIDY